MAEVSSFEEFNDIHKIILKRAAQRVGRNQQRATRRRAVNEQQVAQYQKTNAANWHTNNNDNLEAPPNLSQSAGSRLAFDRRPLSQPDSGGCRRTSRGPARGAATIMTNSKVVTMRTTTKPSRQNLSHRMMSCLITLTTLSCAILIQFGHPNKCAAASSPGESSASVADRLAERTKHLVDLGRSSGGRQLGDWLVHQVAPVVATKLIDNVLQKPGQSGGKTRSAKSADLPIDTQALADKIVDKLADSIKKKSAAVADATAASAAATSASKATADHAEQAGRSGAVTSDPSSNNHAVSAKAGNSRRGKSLVSDSVQQVMQNLFSRDPQRTFLGRAMEKHAKMASSSNHHHHHQQHQSASSNHHHHQQRPTSTSPQSWLMIKEPVYESHLFASTDSSQLDDNPVVLRAEHGHNLTTMSPPTNQYVPPTRDSLINKQQALYNKQKYQQQQKYNSVHTNRHNQQQQLAPKPWPQHQAVNRRPQQSPYSLPTVTSDMNIVQAPSSPPPPPITTSTQPTTTTSTSTTTSLPPSRETHSGSSTYLAPTHHQITHLGANKFKINNRHQAPPSSVAISPNSWFSSNHNSRYQHHHNSRYPMPSQPGSSSTTSTTSTTTTTTTTTPEPQTEPLMPADMINGMDGGPMLSNDLDQQTSSPVSSILSSVAQTALDALGSSSSMSAASSSSQPDDPYSSSSSNSYQQAAQFNSSSSGGSGSGGSSPAASYPSQASAGAPTKGGALPSTTTARHSILSSDAIPTALGAPLYHLTRANFTTHSLMGPVPPPPRRSGAATPAAKAVAQYLQKSMSSLSSTIFSRQSKGWARRLGLSSVLLSGLLYGAAVLSNPGAPLPSNGLEVLQALSKGAKKRRGGSSAPSLANVPAALANGIGVDQLVASASNQNNNNNNNNNNNAGDIDRITTNTAALLDNNVQLLYQQQPQLIAIIEHLIQQEQQQLLQRQQQSSLFAQRSGSGVDYMSAASSPIEIFNVQDSDDGTSYYTSIAPTSSSHDNNRPQSRQELLSPQNSFH